MKLLLKLPCSTSPEAGSHSARQSCGICRRQFPLVRLWTSSKFGVVSMRCELSGVGLGLFRAQGMMKLRRWNATLPSLMCPTTATFDHLLGAASAPPGAVPSRGGVATPL